MKQEIRDGWGSLELDQGMTPALDEFSHAATLAFDQALVSTCRCLAPVHMEGIEWVGSPCSISRLLAGRHLARLTGETAGGEPARLVREAAGDLSPVFDIFHLLHRVRTDINDPI